MKYNKAKYKERQLVEFKDYQDQKKFVGRIASIIHADTNPINEYYYVLNRVNFGERN